MFQTTISTLQQGLLPEPASYNGRLRAALVKKLAMLQLGRQFRHNDDKINPNASHMLWAAIILEEKETVATCLDILLTEDLESRPAKASSNPDDTAIRRQQLLRQSLEQLLATSSSPSLNSTLRAKIEKVTNYK